MGRKVKEFIIDESKIEEGRCYSHEEIGEIMGLTKMRICQIEKEALRKIAAMPNARQLMEFMFNDRGDR